MRNDTKVRWTILAWIVLLSTLSISRTASEAVVLTSAPSTGPQGQGHDTTMRPILDMLAGQNYHGLRGGLYPSGTNVMPAAHDAEGRARALAIQPIGGKVVLLSIGLSNSHQEWCGKNRAAELPCNAWTFMGRAASAAEVDHEALVIVNGALAGQETETWDEVSHANYARIQANWLTPLRLTSEQVQVVQMLELTGPVFDGTTSEPPTPSLEGSDADAYYLVAQYGAIARALKTVYPNLTMIFVSPRAYGGYGTSAEGNANPEPYAYETGWAVKLLIEAQLAQCPTRECNGPIDARAGDLGYANGTAPWLAWGAYLWADGTVANSEGLFYLPGDFQASGQHPTKAGETLIGEKLLEFFLASPYTAPWFRAQATSACTLDHTCLRSTDIRLAARGSDGNDVGARVAVRNDEGVPIPDATVSATWTLPDGTFRLETAVTGAKGHATLSVRAGPGTSTFTITNISKAGYAFDAANSVLTKSITR